jgi:uncharacterized protein YqeY
MLAREKDKLEALRAIKSAVLLAKTEKAGADLDSDTEIKMLQKLVKTRQESMDIFEKNGRPELAEKEREEVAVVRRYLPAMLEGAELEAIIQGIMAEVGATSAKDMGKVMGAASKALAGKAEGRTISETVKKLLG